MGQDISALCYGPAPHLSNPEQKLKLACTNELDYLNIANLFEAPVSE
jgi:hypothetical protein